MERNIEYMIIPPSEENIALLEKLRFDSYGIKINEVDMDSFHANAIREGRILVFACFVDDNLSAACYVTNTYNSLFIDHLFVKRSLQESGLRLGRRLLSYINLNKKLVEEYFGQELKTSRLEYNSTKSKTLYEKIGYRETNSTLGTMKKAI
ncbi:MAG: GNAT family N-acetyltransferase [Bacilli bacterium]|nr:GNAT family N-acetyltransferase [Bacilli bacterium]